MGTATSFSVRNLQWTNPMGGLPLDNGLYKATSDQKFHIGSRVMHPIDGGLFVFGRLYERSPHAIRNAAGGFDCQ